MEQKLRSLGIRKTGDVRSLIEHNNSLPYKERDSRLTALYDLIVAYNSASPSKSRIRCSKDAYECLAPYMMDLDHEEVFVVFLNKVHDVLKIKRMFIGGLDSAIIDNRLVIIEAIMMKATSIIISHNHPSGEAKPSKIDIEMTEKLKKAANVCDIYLVDHLVISGNKYYSMAEENGIL